MFDSVTPQIRLLEAASPKMGPQPFNYVFYACSATDWQRHHTVHRVVEGTLSSMRCLSDDTITADVLIEKCSMR